VMYNIYTQRNFSVEDSTLRYINTPIEPIEWQKHNIVSTVYFLCKLQFMVPRLKTRKLRDPKKGGKRKKGKRIEIPLIHQRFGRAHMSGAQWFWRISEKMPHARVYFPVLKDIILHRGDRGVLSRDTVLPTER
jgi:hypothetical protein